MEETARWDEWWRSVGVYDWLTSHRELMTLEPIVTEWLTIWMVAPLEKEDYEGAKGRRQSKIAPSRA
jgi:hypothetical protein